MAEREALLDDTARIAALELLDKQIIVKQDIYDNLQKKINTLDKNVIKAKTIYDDRTQEYDKSITKQQNMYNGLVANQEKLTEAINSAHKKLQEVTAEIVAQKKYLKDQEQVVNDTVADWNGQLTGMQAEVDALQDAKSVILADRIQMEQSKQVKLDEITALEQKAKTLQEVFDRNMQHAKIELSEVQNMIQQENNRLGEISQTIKSRLETINSREQALQIIDRAQQAKELDLSERERRLNMQLNLI